MFRKALLLAPVFLCVFSAAQAGRPIETDDASAAELRTCQLDFWTETTQQTRQDNFNGGCNFFGSGEFSLSLGEVHGNQGDQSLRAFGYKHIFQNFSDTTPGFGLAASKEWGQLQASDKSSQETLFTAITTVPMVGEDLLMHLNLGYLQYSDQVLKDDRVFKAAALDYSFNERVGFSVETYSGVEDSLSWRLGARNTVFPDFMQIDASYGSDYGTFEESRAFTIGLGITPGF